MTVLTDLCFQEDIPNEMLTFLIGRVKQTKDLPHLCCRKLELVRNVAPLPILGEILNIVQLDSVQEMRLLGSWDLQSLNWFAPYLAQMVQLHTLLLSECTLYCIVPGENDEDEAQKLLQQFTTQLLSLHQLHTLMLHSVNFFGNHLHQLLRSLQAPLETLHIRRSLLMDQDLTYLSSCPCTSHLKSLDLSGVRRPGSNYEFLPALLNRVSATLAHLDLADCGITDSDCDYLQPALGHCSQLRTLKLCGNPLSMAVLQTLLFHTFPRCNFAFLELPVPLNCYMDPQLTLPWHTLAEVMEQLRLTLQLHGPQRIRLAYRHCRTLCDAICIRMDN
ncbi:PRAME family member 27-like [Tenrec ecaudatus]|uniref:PRAME family member 27-like n=1 Tax=Tenrec ecaudatus TaxID=94439 RepID=UPI003F591B1C